jgi:hypothetical protein
MFSGEKCDKRRENFKTTKKNQLCYVFRCVAKILLMELCFLPIMQVVTKKNNHKTNIQLNEGYTLLNDDDETQKCLEFPEKCCFLA